MEPPEGDEMKRAPVPRNDRLLSAEMVWRVALLVPVAAGLTFGWFVWRQAAGIPYELVRTETFTLLAVCQWFNVLNCQSATRSALRLGVLGNRWLLAGLAVSVLLQAAVLYTPTLNDLFYTVPLSWRTLAALIALASAVLWIEELRKLLRRASQRRGLAA
jgi:Ca2+-transporting ATPase